MMVTKIMNLDGVYLIDKQTGMTSHDVVDALRKILKTKAVGHGGTLDPLATGLLICLVGDATKLSQYVMAEEKSYLVGIRLGIRTDSGDITGAKIAESDASSVTEEMIKGFLPSLTGDLELEVPKYSAVKVKGKKLYEYARKNEDVELPKKTMSIREVKFLGFESGIISLEINCEKGTYVRSWVEELGRKLGCGATVESLRRTASGSFNINQAYTLSDLAAKNEADVLSGLVPLEDVLGHWPALKITGRDQSLMVHGQISKGVFSQVLHFDFKSGVRVLKEDGGLLALIVRDQAVGIKLARVFPNH
jgi:tRNA pseudouridine55 synthase